MSANLPAGETLRSVEPAAAHVLRVETVFRVTDELHGQAVAARMIDRAHEIANRPECDVDVSVEWVRPDDSADPGGVPTRGRSAGPGGAPTHGRSVER